MHSNPEDVQIICQPIELIDNDMATPSCNVNCQIKASVCMKLVKARGQAIHIGDYLVQEGRFGL